jgi:hypothetical protein
MLVLQLAYVRAAERGLQSEYIGNLEFAPHGYSGGGLFAQVIRESRVFKTEAVAQFRHDVREDACLVGRINEVVAVNKYVFLTAVAMEV